MTPQEMYAGEMMEILKRVSIIRRIIDKKISLNTENQNIEICYLNFRKILEHIAFSSLIANEEKYSKIQKNYRKFYKAKKILEEISKLNKNFYPKPVNLNLESSIKHASFINYCALNKEQPLEINEFEDLYDISSNIIHIHNPFSRKDYINLMYSTEKWLRKICALLNQHMIQFIDSNDWWLVVMSGEDGKPHVYTLKPKESENIARKIQ